MKNLHSTLQLNQSCLFPSHKIIVTTIVTIAIFFQISLLLIFWGRPFYVDWTNHVWMTQYYATYFMQHGTFPTTIDTIEIFGSSSPLFYGVFFYPFTSILSIFIGADAAIRIICCFLFLTPILTFTILFRSFTNHRYLPILLSIVINSSIYQLTNLYQRSALTEYAAYQLLLISISLIFYGATRKSKIGNIALSLGFACAALSLGTHPITFYTFSIFVGLLSLLNFFSLRRIIINSQIPQIIFWTITTFFILLPWIINTIKYQKKLLIGIVTKQLTYFPTSIDSFLGKIGFFYIDPRVLTRGMHATSTPFLNAPFSLSLLLILFVTFYYLICTKKNEILKFVIPSIFPILLIIYTIIPVHKNLEMDSIISTDGWLYTILSPIQFVYRLTNTFSLCAIISFIIGFILLNKIYISKKYTSSLMFFTYIACFLILINIIQQFYLTYVEKDEWVRRHHYQEMIHDMNHYPDTFYGRGDYIMPNLFSSNTTIDTKNYQSIFIPINTWNKPISINCTQSCLIETHIVPSAFLKILIDGLPARKDQFFSGKDNYMKFVFEPGNYHLQINTIGTFIPYISISIWLVLFWFFSSFFILFGYIIKKYFL